MDKFILIIILIIIIIGVLALLSGDDTLVRLWAEITNTVDCGSTICPR